MKFLSGCFLDGHSQVYNTLMVSIDKYGVKGLKGFFYAIFKKNDASSVTLEINPEVVLPPEKW